MSKQPDPACLCCKGTGTFYINHGPVHGEEPVACDCTLDDAEMDARFVQACEQVNPFNRCLLHIHELIQPE